jgi:hypothetical protein
MLHTNHYTCSDNEEGVVLVFCYGCRRFDCQCNYLAILNYAALVIAPKSVIRWSVVLSEPHMLANSHGFDFRRISDQRRFVYDSFGRRKS